MTQTDLDYKRTLLGRFSSVSSLSELQENIFNIESFTNYSFSRALNSNSKSLFKSFKISLITLSALFLIALLTSFIACFIDLVAFNMIHFKKELVLYIQDPYLSCSVWVLISLLFITCATSFGYFFAPEADGSGIPEVKAILSGVEMPNHLTLKTFFCKIFGLICCSGALSIGKEGPHAHLAIIIAHQILSWNYFKSLRTHPGFQTRIMEASVAAGVSAVMAAPIGSVFFSMELTSTHYMIPNIIYSLYCGTLCSFFLAAYRLLNLTEVVNQTHIPIGFNNADLVIFVLIGIVAGIAGVSFTMLTKKLVEFRGQKKIPWLHKRYRYAWTVTLIFSITSFALPFMMLGAKQILNELLANGDLPETWNYCGTFGSLILFCLLKMFFTAASSSVQIPGGVFLPVFISGAAFGRIMHGLSVYIGGIAGVGMFASVSGAAFVASTCHSLSISLIIFEMTGQIHYAIPMLLCVIISFSIGSSIGLNMYDAMILLKKLPYLPAIRKSKLYRTNIVDIMESASSVPHTCNFKQLRDALLKGKGAKVVVIDENSYLLADLGVNNGKKYLKKALEGFKEAITKEQYDRIYSNLDKPEFVDEEYEKLQKSNSRRFDPENLSSYFWEFPVDFGNKTLKLNRSPVSVESSTSLYKIHYLFLMLGLTQLYITKDFKLSGVLYRHYFTSTKK